MRVWSLHPEYLDRIGLVACWRETLLAQAVLAGRTRGYRHHPQLTRFRDTPEPLATVGAYLVGLRAEAERRGYRFDATRIDRPAGEVAPLPVSTGQVALEWDHLMAKLAVRSPDQHAAVRDPVEVAVHPLFVVVPGPVAEWERAGPVG